ncbi:MAG: hypothetical protein H7338_01485 [Candidatus Sericytochromatia bacterium]|nr:hypothetical protein [Candidatus Sericytochromatia bacterium]
MSELSYEAVRSLHAINQWTDIIEANITGTQKTAYKVRKPKFSLANKTMTGSATGGALRPPGAPPDVIIPSASLVIDDVTPEMKQGDIIGSTQDTHLAINGVGYFIVVESMDMDPILRQEAMFTRDGEFHWDEKGFMRTQNGLFVATRRFPPFKPERDAIAAAVVAGTDSYDNYYMNRDRVAFAGVPPVFPPDIDYNGLVDANQVGLCRVPYDGGLEYSKFGTTYLQEALSSGRPVYFNTGDPTTHEIIVKKSLETSNSSMTEHIPMLSMASKMFAAVSKIIAVYNSTVDDMNGLIR